MGSKEKERDGKWEEAGGWDEEKMREMKIEGQKGKRGKVGERKGRARMGKKRGRKKKKKDKRKGKGMK